MQNLSGIMSITDVFSIYIPALTLLLINYFGFSTNLNILFYSFITTTPYRLGSWTVDKTMLAFFPCFLWNYSNYVNGKSQITSLLTTKIMPDELSLRRWSRENLIGPAVPNGYNYCEYVNLTLYFCYICYRSFLMMSPR